jgi:hypothetical protein
LLGEKIPDGSFISQVNFRPRASDQINETVRLKQADKGAANQSAVAGDVNFIALFHPQIGV